MSIQELHLKIPFQIDGKTVNPSKIICLEIYKMNTKWQAMTTRNCQNSTRETRKTEIQNRRPSPDNNHVVKVGIPQRTFKTFDWLSMNLAVTMRLIGCPS